MSFEIRQKNIRVKRFYFRGHPSYLRRPRAIVRHKDVCEVWWLEDNVQKRPFMLLTPARFTTPIVAAEAYSNKFLTRPTRWDWLSQAQS